MRRAADFARRWPYTLKCDVRKYFPSIDHGVLMGLLGRVIGDRKLLDLIRHILDTHQDGSRQEWPPGGDLFDVRLLKRGLPIGNLTSQFFANVYLNPLDHFVKHELRVKGYVRYMDDFILFGNDRGMLRDQGRRVKDKLAELRLEMHPDKYRLLRTRCGVDFAGYVVFAGGRGRGRASPCQSLAECGTSPLGPCRAVGKRASGTNAPVRRVACVAAIGTIIPTTCTPPIATTTTRRTRTTT